VLSKIGYQPSAFSYQPRKGISKNKAQGELISGQNGQLMICVNLPLIFLFRVAIFDPLSSILDSILYCSLPTASCLSLSFGCQLSAVFCLLSLCALLFVVFPSSCLLPTASCLSLSLLANS